MFISIMLPGGCIRTEESQVVSQIQFSQSCTCYISTYMTLGVSSTNKTSQTRTSSIRQKDEEWMVGSEGLRMKDGEWRMKVEC